MKIEENQEEPGSGRVTFNDLSYVHLSGEGLEAFSIEDRAHGVGKSPEALPKESQGCQKRFQDENEESMPGDSSESGSSSGGSMNEESVDQFGQKCRENGSKSCLKW